MIWSTFGRRLVALPGVSALKNLITVDNSNWSGTDLAVDNGGTGRSAHTAYAVICGGTTTTGAQQSIVSVGTSGDILTSNGAGALPTFQAAAAGVVAATQAELETGSATNVYVSPGLQQYHPSAAKFWAKVAGAGTLTSSYNVTSVTDTGTGNLTVNIATDFSTADWACLVTIAATPDITGPGYTNRIAHVTAQAAGTVTVQCLSFTISDTGLAAQNASNSDPTTYFVAGFGDQA